MYCRSSNGADCGCPDREVTARQVAAEGGSGQTGEGRERLSAARRPDVTKAVSAPATGMVPKTQNRVMMYSNTRSPYKGKHTCRTYALHMTREASPTRCPPMPQMLAYTHSRRVVTRRRFSISFNSACVNSFCRVIAEGISGCPPSVVVAVDSSGESSAMLGTSDGRATADFPTVKGGPCSGQMADCIDRLVRSMNVLNKPL